MTIGTFFIKSGERYSGDPLPEKGSYKVCCAIYIHDQANSSYNYLNIESSKEVCSEVASKIQKLWFEALNSFPPFVESSNSNTPLFKGCYGLAVTIHTNPEDPHFENIILGQITRDLTLFHAMNLQAMFSKIVEDLQ